MCRKIPAKIINPFTTELKTSPISPPTLVIIFLTKKIIKNKSPKIIAPIEIETNNEYLRKGIESWVDSWAKSGWKKASGDKISFKAFWEKVYNLKKSKEVVVYGKRT